MNSLMAALSRRRTIAIAVLAMLVVALPVALYAIDNASAREQRDRDGRSSPASIRLAPSPTRIDCNGQDFSRLTITLRDKYGRSVRNGTEVFFDVRNGFADPVETKTRNGQATTKVRLYASAAFYGGGQVFVHAGDLRASIYINCKPTGPNGCNEPFSPPLHPMSPPCETPEPPSGCSFSPPQHPMSPPCGPSLPSPECGPADTGTTPEYGLTLRAEEQDGIVTAYVGIEDLGGGSWFAAQWHVCRSPILAFTGVSPAPGAPTGCDHTHDDRSQERTLLGCLEPGTVANDEFGDMFVVKYACTRAGSAHVHVADGAHAGPQSFVARDPEGNYAPIRVDGLASIECTQAATQSASSSATPQPQPSTTRRPQPPPTGCEEGQANPSDAQYGMTLRAEEDSGVITVYAGMEDKGGGTYRAAQWSICRSRAVGFLDVRPAEGAPSQCHLSSEDGERTLLGCIDLSPEPTLNAYGDMWVVRYQCLRPGDVRLYLGRDQTNAYGAPDGTLPTNTQSAQVTCTQAAPGMTPSPTPPANCHYSPLYDEVICSLSSENPAVP